MTNTVLLQDIILESGLKKKYIAVKLGLTFYGFQKKVLNQNQFKAEEIQILCEILNIKSLKLKESIFFNQNVDK